MGQETGGAEKKNRRKFHEESWKAVCDYFGLDDEGEEAPYLYEKSRTDAYQEVFKSLNLTGIPQPDFPVPNSVLYYYDSEIVGPSGVPTLNITIGGVNVPPDTSEKYVEMLHAKENVRYALRTMSMVYDLSLVVRSASPALSDILLTFEERAVEALTAKIFGFDKKDFAYALAYSRGDMAQKLTEPAEPEQTARPAGEIEARVESMCNTIQQDTTLIEKYDPLTHWPSIMGKMFSEHTVRPVTEFYGSLERLHKNSGLVVKKRKQDGTWEEITPSFEFSEFSESSESTETSQ